MILKEIIDDLTIPDNGLYNSEEWFIYIQNILKYILKYSHGNREIFLDLVDDDRTVTISNVEEYINALFIMNNFKYKKLCEALFAEFNPLWNVDGKETMIYTRDNTGTQTNVVDHTGSQDIDHTLTEGIIHTSATSKTSYNSSAFNDVEKTVDTPSGTFNKDEMDRTDTLTDDATRTDNLKEEYSEVKIRQGNIGVTKSTDLIESAVELRRKYDLANLISSDIIEYIAYS